MDNGRWRDRWMSDNRTFLTPYFSVKILNYFEMFPSFALYKETDISIAIY